MHQTSIIDERKSGKHIALTSRRFLLCVLVFLLIIQWRSNIVFTSNDPTDDTGYSLEFESSDSIEKVTSTDPKDDTDYSLEFESSDSMEKVCHKRIHLTVVSDRKRSDYPLKALINSILNYTTSPVTLNIVTKNNIPFLDELNSTYFRIHYHHPMYLLEASRQLIKETGFRSVHYSADFAMQKLFLNQLQYSKEDHAEKVLVLDDDFTFFTDMTPLWDSIIENPNNISLYCPEDKERVQRYFNFTGKRAPNNGDPFRYCNSGIMGVPIAIQSQSSNFTHHAVEATRRMTKEYDFSYSVADQDIVNRMLAEDKNGFEFIPCQWGCDVNSCAGTAPNRGKCSTCLGQKCTAYHWVQKRFEQNNGKKWGHPRFNFLHYYQLNSTELLASTFTPKIEANC
jgi:hypothetical protein